MKLIADLARIATLVLIGACASAPKQASPPDRVLVDVMGGLEQRIHALTVKHLGG